jgi:hypothetical protein
LVSWPKPTRFVFWAIVMAAYNHWLSVVYSYGLPDVDKV